MLESVWPEGAWEDGKAKVLVVLGSESDYDKIQILLQSLQNYQISYACVVASAHRNSEELDELVTSSYHGCEFIIAVAGMAAALGGVIAARTAIPVFGVPIPSTNDPDGLLAKYATNELPPGAAQVAVLGDNVADNSRRIANLISRVISFYSDTYDGFEEFKTKALEKKPARIPYITGEEA